jgi:hypothetical protein
MFGSAAVLINDPVPEYDHTQWSMLYLLLLVPGAVLVVAAPFVESQTESLGLSLLGLFVGATAYSFRCLRVVDEGAALAVRYGTLPAFRKRIRYADIAESEKDRSSIIDGWGIHWVPGRGWTYNLWGYDCVRLTLKSGRTVRIGSDDPEGLVRFLESRLARSS